MGIEVQFLKGFSSPQSETHSVEGHKVRTTLGPFELEDFTKVSKGVSWENGLDLWDVIEPLKVMSVLDSNDQLLSESVIKEPAL